MTDSSQFTALDSGIVVIHANQLETLRDMVAYWLKQYPLAPLENEVILVQSGGMGQWLKHHLAQNEVLGIAATLTMQLPSLFNWHVYRAVLGAEVPTEQLLAKAPLIWRLYKMLPELIRRSEFSVLKTFLVDDDYCLKRYQLAERLADLFDQYQVYRADWVSDWANGQDVLRSPDHKAIAIPAAQRWQAALWRAVLKDLGEDASLFAGRASVHEQFMAQIDSLAVKPGGIPRRIILFGLSSLPPQSLEVIAKLGKFCQILLFVPNPCRYYWADIIEDKELLKAERHRQPYKSGTTAGLTVEELHLYANPLLAAWGKQGRDYLCMLDQFDDSQTYAKWQWPENKINVFNDFGEHGQRSLLQCIQQTILDLEPVPDMPIPLVEVDDSLAFHIAHSPQREVEILHDQLLARFDKAQQRGAPLSPRDVIVMMPDINLYAPHIRAVFGLVKADDPRYIPYTLNDQQQRGHNPLLVAIETLLNLAESRLSVSEVFGLLEVPAIRERFAIAESVLPKLHQWIEESGIRWGLDAKHRNTAVDMPTDIETNSWLFGLRRMLLGYAVGAGAAFNGIEPYEEIGGLDAQVVGGLAYFVESLATYIDKFQQPKRATEWQESLSAMLDDFFLASADKDRKTIETLTEASAKWQQYCQQAGMSDNDLIPIYVVREAWLSGVDEPTLHQRFLSGRVNFCTLMPMRAIPFRVVCILGMNDGDYPRQQPFHSFDLLAQRGQYRPGDRLRRQDDQYLFLEALLSAREQLYISWVGRSCRDNSELPPSVLISQLREVIQQTWQLSDSPSLVDALTLVHPLQPFSQNYVLKNRDPRLFTYAHEWFEPLPAISQNERTPIIIIEPNSTLSLETLARFLRAPVKTFCQQTLKISFEQENITSDDNEPFALDGLQTYLFKESLLNALLIENPVDVDGFFDDQLSASKKKGQLPLGNFAPAVVMPLAQAIKQTWTQYQLLLTYWCTDVDTRNISLPFFDVGQGGRIQLTGKLTQLRHHCHKQKRGFIHVTAQPLGGNRTIKYHNMLLYWLQHLAGSAVYGQVQTFVVAADGLFTISPIEQSMSLSLLQTLVDAYCFGLTTPLPIASKTAFAWLGASPDKAQDKARLTYEGDGWNFGEVNYDAYLNRLFPTFAHMNTSADKHGFDYWANALYRPVYTYIRPYTKEQDASS